MGRRSTEQDLRVRKQRAREFYDAYGGTGYRTKYTDALRKSRSEVGIEDLSGVHHQRGSRSRGGILRAAKGVLNSVRLQQSLVRGITKATIDDSQSVFLAGIPQEKRVVIDVCCAMEALRSPGSESDRVVNLAMEEEIFPLAVPFLLDHYAIVIARGCLGLGQMTPKEKQRLSDFAEIIHEIPTTYRKLPSSLVNGDRGDLALLQTAMVGEAPVITQDFRHVLSNANRIREELRVEVMTPKNWLELIAPSILGEMEQD